MRHAFLIIAHNNWWQLKKLISFLDHEQNDIFVHIDKKSVDFPWMEFEGITRKSKLCIFQEIRVYWGGYSQVAVELFLMEQAHAGVYDYYHIISGADIPLKSNREIHAFFEANAGKEFINLNEELVKNNPEIKRRTKLYHFLQDYRRRYHRQWINSCFIGLERSLLLLQMIAQVDRTKNLDWTIKYGSQWISISHELVCCILKHKEKIGEVFSLTNCADELFVQTIAYNCGFREKIYQPLPGENANMRLVDWSRGRNGSPYTFRSDDFEMLTSTPTLFARKFSETVDRKIIEQLYEWLEQR